MSLNQQVIAEFSPCTPSAPQLRDLSIQTFPSQPKMVRFSLNWMRSESAWILRGTHVPSLVVRGVAKGSTERRQKAVEMLRHTTKPDPDSGRIDPHLTLCWPFGRVTEGLPTIYPERPEPPYSGLNA